MFGFQFSFVPGRRPSAVGCHFPNEASALANSLVLLQAPCTVVVVFPWPQRVRNSGGARRRHRLETELQAKYQKLNKYSKQRGRPLEDACDQCIVCLENGKHLQVESSPRNESDHLLLLPHSELPQQVSKTALPKLANMQRRMSVTIREYKFFRSFSQKFENWPKRKAEALWRKMRERKIAGESGLGSPKGDTLPAKSCKLVGFIANSRCQPASRAKLFGPLAKLLKNLYTIMEMLVWIGWVFWAGMRARHSHTPQIACLLFFRTPRGATPLPPIRTAHPPIARHRSRRLFLGVSTRAPLFPVHSLYLSVSATHLSRIIHGGVLEYAFQY